MISSNSGAASDFAASVVSAFASAAAAVVSPAAAAVVSAGLDDPHPANDDTIITPASTNANLFSYFYFLLSFIFTDTFMSVNLVHSKRFLSPLLTDFLNKLHLRSAALLCTILTKNNLISSFFVRLFSLQSVVLRSYKDINIFFLISTGFTQ